MLLLIGHANTKAKSIGTILFPLTVFSVFLIKTCIDFHQLSPGKQKLKSKIWVWEFANKFNAQRPNP